MPRRNNQGNTRVYIVETRHKSKQGAWVPTGLGWFPTFAIASRNMSVTGSDFGYEYRVSEYVRAGSLGGDAAAVRGE